MNDDYVPDLIEGAFSYLTPERKHEWTREYTAAEINLFTQAANMPRDSLKDRVPYSDKKLESMTRKYLSRSPQFQEGYVSILQRPLPTYEAWCRSIGIVGAEYHAHLESMMRDMERDQS
jgi:hypothetical protein